MADSPRVLIVDDDPSVQKLIGKIARAAGYSCSFLGDASGFGAALASPVDLVVLDLQLPSVDGIELLRRIAVSGRAPAVVLISGVDTRVLATAVELGKAHGLNIAGSFAKPFSVAALESFFSAHCKADSVAPRERRAAPAVSAELLSQALRENQFVLHYQPKIDLTSRKIVGTEGLVRWNQPGGRLVFPDAFIGLAEREGLIDLLGWTVFNIALPACSRFRDALGPVHGSVNVSARSLHDLDMPDRLGSMLDEIGLPHSALTLEITESGLMERLSAALDILTRLRLKGMNLSIDDFGTGFAMMQQLRRVPATELKIDRTFVQEAATDSAARVVVQKTIEIGHDLGMRVVAEGVETREQLLFLEALGCDEAQGYYFARPMPEPNLLEWAERYSRGTSPSH